MKNPDSLRLQDQDAAQYDRQIHAYNSYGHDVLFGMSFDYVNPRDCLLDLGIGTGLSSRSFAKMGLDVYGCDGSWEMLKICESKAFAKELKMVDLRDVPLPYSDCFFDHVICCGVLHFIEDLDVILKEVLRLVKPGGIFAFTVAAQTAAEEASNGNQPKNYSARSTPWGRTIFKHSSGYISKLLHVNGFDILKKQQLVMRDRPVDDSENILFNALVTCNKRAVNA